MTRFPVTDVVALSADATEVPSRFPSPFAMPPAPVAKRAARELVAALPSMGVDVAALHAEGGGKMFGVLVVRDAAGKLGYLRAFSGMLGEWQRGGFAPPLFDTAARDAMWPAGQAVLREHEVALQALLRDGTYTSPRHALRSFDDEIVRDRDFMREKHRVRKEARAVARAATTDAEALHALDQESRADAAEKKRFEAERATERAFILSRVAEGDARRVAIEEARAAESRGLMKQVHDHYTIANARGEVRALRELFVTGEPPAGAADCAAPKLLGAAYRQGLVPIALAEVWVGAPPATGGRHDGAFYPACRGKCGPVLPWMLGGLEHEPVPEPGADAISSDEPRVVYADEHLIVVDKPVGLLSVPGRSGALRDSVQTRLRARYPAATGPMIVHRLDLDTSGLLLVALTAEVHTQLQAMFARHEIEKTYAAVVSGLVVGEAGTIDLPLRVDLDDRPRQIVDAVHGKSAITEWTVVSRDEVSRQTVLALSPRTGRTHQLRVHCALPLAVGGIGAPIVGDRLYGARDSHAEPRMLLHAERLAFTHPVTGTRLELRSPAPF
ncbi:MAG TPA: RluA family pseudouridine synthase [Kofleriaceae bacterium]